MYRASKNVNDLVNIGKNDESISFRYNYLKQYMKSDGFVKMFELNPHEVNQTQSKKWIYLLLQNNKKRNSENAKNPYFSQVSVIRY